LPAVLGTGGSAALYRALGRFAPVKTDDDAAAGAPIIERNVRLAKAG